VQTQVPPKFPKAALTAAKVFLTGVGAPKIVPLPSLLSIWMNLALDMTDVDGTWNTVELANLGGHLMRSADASRLAGRAIKRFTR